MIFLIFKGITVLVNTKAFYKAKHCIIQLLCSSLLGEKFKASYTVYNGFVLTGDLKIK